MKRLILFSLIGIALQSCIWSPTEVYEREVNNNATPPVITPVEFNFDLAQDTIELNSPVIYYNFSSSGQKIKKVLFYLDESLNWTEYTNQGIFHINGLEMYDRYFNFRIDVFTNSGTGSLADTLGVEGYLFASREWTIIFRQNVSQGVVAFPSNGFLKLVWVMEQNKPMKIRRSNGEIGMSSVGYFVDSSYVGEAETYYLYDSNNTQQGVVQVPKRLPNLSKSADESNRLCLKWESSFFWAAIDSLILQIYSADNLINSVAFNPQEGQNYLLENVQFGDEMTFRLQIKRKYQGFTPFDEFSEYLQMLIGFEFPMFNAFYNINPNEVIFHANQFQSASLREDDSLFRFSTLSERMEERFRYSFSNPWSGDNLKELQVSPGREKLVALLGDFSNRVFYSKSSDFSDYKIVDINNYNPNKKVVISNNGIGVFSGYGAKYLYDFENEMLLGQINSVSASSDYKISSTGKYFYFDAGSCHYYYSYQNNTIRLEKRVYAFDNDFYDYIAYHPTNPEQFVAWHKELNLFRHINCSNFEVVNSFSLAAEVIQDIDFYNGYILAIQSDRFSIIDLNNGSIIHEVPTRLSIWEKKRCFLGGNSIFYQKGLRYFLP